MKAARRSLTGWLLLALVAAAGVYAYRSGMIVVPEAWKPWVALRVDDTPNVFTSWKLMRASADDLLCLDVLGDAQIDFDTLPDRETGPGCGFSNAVRVTRTSAAVGEPFSLSCRAALSLAMWERHVLQPEAQRLFGSPVARIEHFGSYACRNVYSREGAARSRHATADALDIAGFVLDSGQRIRVVSDWRDETPASSGDAGSDAAAVADTDDADESIFLRKIHRGACRWFDAVLGPDYNAAHADHFHFDRGGYRACR